MTPFWTPFWRPSGDPYNRESMNTLLRPLNGVQGIQHPFGGVPKVATNGVHGPNGQSGQNGQNGHLEGMS